MSPCAFPYQAPSFALPRLAPLSCASVPLLWLTSTWARRTHRLRPSLAASAVYLVRQRGLVCAAGPSCHCRASDSAWTCPQGLRVWAHAIMSYDEIEIEDMDWSENLQAFTYSCPCGDLFSITVVCLQPAMQMQRLVQRYSLLCPASSSACCRYVRRSSPLVKRSRGVQAVHCTLRSSLTRCARYCDLAFGP